MTYLAVGYCTRRVRPRARPTSSPTAAGSPANAPLTTLLYANPTTTEALLFGLDLDRVRRWLYANDLATPAEIADATDLKRWFAGSPRRGNGQLPVFARRGDRPPQRAVRPAAHHGPPAAASPRGGLRLLARRPCPSTSSRTNSRSPSTPTTGASQPSARCAPCWSRTWTRLSTGRVDNDTCMYDPNCMEANRGADHGCLFLPETACRCWNRYLSRHYLYGAPDGTMIGYWDPSL